MATATTDNIIDFGSAGSAWGTVTHYTLWRAANFVGEHAAHHEPRRSQRRRGYVPRWRLDHPVTRGRIQSLRGDPSAGGRYGLR